MKHRFVLLFLLSTSLAGAQSADLPSFSVAPSEVYEAGVELHADGHASLRVNLIAGKRKEFADFTGKYLEKQVQIVVNGTSLAQPVVRQQMLSGSLDLPCDSPEAALALAKTLMAK